MTREELDEAIERAVTGFSSLEGVDDSLAEKLVGEGFLSYDDLSVIEPDDLMEMGALSEEQVQAIVDQAEVKAEEAEHAAAEQRRRQREQERIEAATVAAEATEGVLPADQAAAAAETPASEVAADSVGGEEAAPAEPDAVAEPDVAAAEQERAPAQLEAVSPEVVSEEQPAGQGENSQATGGDANPSNV
jgi:transcription termination/antitermination protein NusA